MISVQSYLKVTDNSGARFVKCIKVYGQGIERKAFIGNIVLVSVHKHIPIEEQINKMNRKKKVVKGKIYKAIIVRTKKLTIRNTGQTLKFSDNAVVLLRDLNTLMCTRVFGPVARELRKSGLMKIISLSSGTF
jgi:large subunit ribosomal protein L14